ncbi:MAG: twin-arginine translocation signal domain-containing protein [Jatrophihabitans sp.]
MSENSRRNFLKTASIGAAAVGTAVVVPVAAAQAKTPTHELDSGPAHAGSFTVWVKNADTGTIAVMVGESEVVYTDRKLAKRLARIAARAKA